MTSGRSRSAQALADIPDPAWRFRLAPPPACNRRAAGRGPFMAVPASVREALRRPGQSLPAGLRGDGNAARLVISAGAAAHRRGRQVGGRRGGASLHGRLAHRVRRRPLRSRAWQTPPADARNSPTPRARRRHRLAGGKRISTPGEATERHAVAVAKAMAPPAMTTIVSPALHRQSAQPAPPVALNGVR